MNIMRKLKRGLEEQGYDEISEEHICFDIVTEEFTLPLCFCIEEDEDSILLVCTTDEGREEVHYINKDYIVFAHIIYNVENIIEKDEEVHDHDKMFG